MHTVYVIQFHLLAIADTVNIWGRTKERRIAGGVVDGFILLWDEGCNTQHHFRQYTFHKIWDDTLAHFIVLYCSILQCLPGLTLSLCFLIFVFQSLIKYLQFWSNWSYFYFRNNRGIYEDMTCTPNFRANFQLQLAQNYKFSRIFKKVANMRPEFALYFSIQGFTNKSQDSTGATKVFNLYINTYLHLGQGVYLEGLLSVPQLLMPAMWWQEGWHKLL